jgi:hypothetical protein
VSVIAPLKVELAASPSVTTPCAPPVTVTGEGERVRVNAGATVMTLMVVAAEAVGLKLASPE